MAVMLRTQGIATRIVNGFQQGEYNETAGAYIVKQKDAHSWVEVYFPENDVWIAFDPTPFAGQINENGVAAGIFGKFQQISRSTRNFVDSIFRRLRQSGTAFAFPFGQKRFCRIIRPKLLRGSRIAETQIADWWKEVRGDKGLQTSAIAVAYGIG